MIKRVATKRNLNVLPLSNPQKAYRLGVSWDCMDGRGLDIDIQAVIVNDAGLIIDAVYYNNLSAVANTITHSGDELRGAADGLDESINVRLSRLPQEIKMIIFCVALYSGFGCLADVDNGMIVLMQNGCRLKEFPIEKSFGQADVVAVMKRFNNGSWALDEVSEPAEVGSHFLDMLEPNIGGIIRAEIPHAPECQRVSFSMVKGSAVSLPQESNVKRLCICVGGTLPAGGAQMVDLDVAAAFYGANGRVIGAVDGGHEEALGAHHTGDHTVGATDYDEAITMDLAQIPSKVTRIFLILTIATGTFEVLESVYARCVDQNAHELLRYDFNMNDGHIACGVIVAQLVRCPGQRWDFEALGDLVATSGASERTWKAAKPQIAALFEKPTVFEEPLRLETAPCRDRAPAPVEEPLVLISTPNRDRSISQPTSTLSSTAPTSSNPAPAKPHHRRSMSSASFRSSMSSMSGSRGTQSAAQAFGTASSADCVGSSIRRHLSRGGTITISQPVSIMQSERSPTKSQACASMEAFSFTASHSPIGFSASDSLKIFEHETLGASPCIGEPDNVPVKDGEEDEVPRTPRPCGAACAWAPGSFFLVGCFAPASAPTGVQAPTPKK